jgi:hypothetical protein
MTREASAHVQVLAAYAAILRTLLDWTARFAV